MADRAVSPVVGIVLLVGLTAVVALSVIVVGVTMIDGVESSAERNQAENSMVELADTADTVASSEARSSDFQFQGDDAGSTMVDASAGNVSVVLVNGSGNRTLTDTSLGVYRHELSDGTEVVYQGGGVWRHGSGEPQLIEPPNFDYRAGDVNGSQKPTLRFPYVRIDGPSVDSGQVDGQLSVTNQTRLTEELQNPVTGEYLYVDIESEYCEGWEEHVDLSTDAEIDENCGDDDQLRVELSVPDSYFETDVNKTSTNGTDPKRSGGDQSYGLYAEEDFVFERAGGTINGTIGAGGNITFSESTGYEQNGDRNQSVPHERTPHDDTIDAYTANATSDSWESFCDGPYDFSCSYDAGTYYVDDLNDGAGDVTFDVGDGNVTLVLRDDLHTDDTTNWRVVNHERGGSVKVYVPGDMTFEGATRMGTAPGPGPDGMDDPISENPGEANAEALQFLGSSDTEIRMAESFHVEAKISAPSTGTENRSEAFAVSRASFSFIGALHAGHIDMSDTSTDIYQDNDVSTREETEVIPGTNGSTTTNTTVRRTNPDAELYYVHVSETVLEIEDEPRTD